MSDGNIVDDAIVWSHSENASYSQATLGKWTAAVWESGSCMRPYRMKLRLGGDTRHGGRIRSFRTKEAAMRAGEVKLREAVSP
jgi:hypothetical protein